MRNQIYYLCDLQLSSAYISTFGDKYIKLYINHVNILTSKYFNFQEQKQLKMDNFDEEKFYSFAYGNLPDDISFDNLDKQKLNDYFEKICIMDIKNFQY